MSLQTNKGSEFMSKEFVAYCNKEGIACQLTQARTPNQNGVAKRKNITIVEKTRSMLYNSKIPLTRF